MSVTFVEAVKKAVIDWSAFSSIATEAVSPIETVVRNRVPIESMPPLVTTDVVSEFKRALLAVIDEAGNDHVCEIRPFPTIDGHGFRYVWDGEGDCLVGRVLVRMGVSAETLGRFEGHSAVVPIEHLWGSPPLVGSTGQRKTVIALATEAQIINDARAYWGRARIVAVR